MIFYATVDSLRKAQLFGLQHEKVRYEMQTWKNSWSNSEKKKDFHFSIMVVKSMSFC